ncbi:YIP1 family protein [Acetivibrio saccincola]|uniref:Yip1 domain protein n=1 Tax=Acetivibrio saccincola TaxID=1677857 RepID=A0A2K9E5N1_9FIRM|nr:YIP1 family protein [Acetivibrio saccincola]AUG56776.1 Yip1 domain protein [Acetivibrio saccincola]
MNKANIARQEQSEDLEELSVLERITGVFISPGKVMKWLAKNPKILLPIIISAIVPLFTLILNYPSFKEALMTAIETELANMGEELIPGTERILEIFLAAGAIMGAVGTVLLDILTISLLLWGIIKLFKGGGELKQYISIVSHAGLISLLVFIVISVVSFIMGKFTLDVSITSLAVIIPESLQGTFIYGVLNNVEIFTIWQYFVIGIGTSEVSGFGKGKSYAIAGGVYLATLLLAGVMNAV